MRTAMGSYLNTQLEGHALLILGRKSDAGVEGGGEDGREAPGNAVVDLLSCLQVEGVERSPIPPSNHVCHPTSS